MLHKFGTAHTQISMHASVYLENTCTQLTLLILLLGHHCHGHGGLGARLSASQRQPADLQRAEIALQSVFGGGVPLLHVFLPFCRSHPVVHLKPHQLRLTARTAQHSLLGKTCGCTFIF